MELHHIRRGMGKPLLLVHGLGGSWRSWQTILDPLAAEREVIAVDLPGHGDTAPLSGETSISTLADALTGFVDEHKLNGVDAVGSSMGARLVLELARRGGVLGAVVSLDPGGFWQGWQIPYFYHSINFSIKLVRLLQPVMPALTGNVISRSLLFAQFSARPRLVKDGQLLTYVSNLPQKLDKDKAAAKRECDFISTPQTFTLLAREKKTVDWFVISQGTYNLGSIKWYEPLQAGHYQLTLRRRLDCCIGAMVETGMIEFDVVANK
jgi:pimeloyl-ACP methyl ester carboxylesterase